MAGRRASILPSWEGSGVGQRASGRLPGAILNFAGKSAARRPTVVDGRLGLIANAVPLTADHAVVAPAALMVKALVSQLARISHARNCGRLEFWCKLLVIRSMAHTQNPTAA